MVYKKRDKKTKFNASVHFNVKKKSQEHEQEMRDIDKLFGEFDPRAAETFGDYPLTKATQKGLEESGYKVPTVIQKQCIPLALQGRDILGAAKTGSGKTLAFVIPVLERLYRLKWSAPDGPGVLVVTPTRELAEQIFGVFKNVGRHHQFSVGLIVGGRNIKKESDRMVNINIVVCTPGRLVHHLRETYGFGLDSVQILVLDEADKMLDMGFKEDLNTVIGMLPEDRQALLFSATQTRCRGDLKRLDSKDLVSVCEKSETVDMPAKLEQIFMVCKAEEKLNLLYSFVHENQKQKILVFMSTCKQVRYVHESFRRINKKIVFLALHGSMKQKRRFEMVEEYRNKRHCVMFATDIACRGLDFPSVDWVIQFDCPSDVETYVHRAGRTARYEEDGIALMLLLPAEKEGMLQELEKHHISVKEERPKKKKLIEITKDLQSLNVRSLELEDFAKKAVFTYLKSVFLMKNKKIFSIANIDRDALSESYGIIPDKKSVIGALGDKQDPIILKRKREDDDDDDDEDEPSPSDLKQVDETGADKSKKVKAQTRAQSVKKMLKQGVKGTKIVFDDEPEGLHLADGDGIASSGKEEEEEVGNEMSITERRRLLLEQDAGNKALRKQRLTEKKIQQKIKVKAEKQKFMQGRGSDDDDDDEISEENDEEGEGYGNMDDSVNNDEEENSNDDDDDDDDDIDEKPSKKKRTSAGKMVGQKRKKMRLT